MPRYYFNFLNRGKTLEDTEGEELPDDEAAFAYACGVARELTRNSPRRAVLFHWTLEVLNAGRKPLLKARLGEIVAGLPGQKQKAAN